MKKIATQTLATLVIIGVMSMSSLNAASMGQRSRATDPKYLKDLEKVYHHHDRRFVLRASVLGVEPEFLREQLRQKPLDTVVKKYGFRDVAAYYTALTGKLRAELRQRGWNEKRLENYIAKRVERVTNMSTPSAAPAV